MYNSYLQFQVSNVKVAYDQRLGIHKDKEYMFLNPYKTNKIKGKQFKE